MCEILLPLLLRETLYEPTDFVFSLFFFCKKVKPTSSNHILLTTIHSCRVRRRGDGMLHMLAACWRLASLKATTPRFQEVVIRSMPISDCSDQCEWHSSGRVMAGERHGMCESVFNTAGNSRRTAWERHGMCESALTGPNLECATRTRRE
jgi:hypothetical protein